MAPTRLPYTYVVRARGREYWRFRRNGLHTSLPGKPGEAAFHSRYAELAELATREPAKPVIGSLAELIAAYRASAEFSVLRPATQLDYGRTLDMLAAHKLGAQPYRLITGPMVKAVRDALSQTPRKAHKVKQMVSRLYTWAQEEGLVRAGHNPAGDFKKLKVRSRTITPWSAEEIDLFLAHCSPHLRIPTLLMLCTGQRTEDVARMEWPAYQGRFIRVRQSKTGEMAEIATHPRLAAALDPVRIRRGRICKAASGRPYTANALRKAVADEVARIDGMPERSCHGLRYAAAAMLEEAGCTVAQIVPIIGHRTYQMAMKYITARRDSEAGMTRVAERNKA